MLSFLQLCPPLHLCRWLNFIVCLLIALCLVHAHSLHWCRHGKHKWLPAGRGRTTFTLGNSSLSSVELVTMFVSMRVYYSKEAPRTVSVLTSRGVEWRFHWFSRHQYFGSRGFMKATQPHSLMQIEVLFTKRACWLMIPRLFLIWFLSDLFLILTQKQATWGWVWL